MKIANGMEFVNDDSVIGKWENIGWISGINSFSVTDLNDKSGEYNILYFLPNGEPYWIFEGWTKGVILINYGGDDPILSYRYDLRDIDGKQYLFFRLDDKTEVFVKADSEHYTKATLGNHDNIDLPFVSDKKLIGAWDSVAFVSETEDFSPENKYDDLFLKSMKILPDGDLIQTYMDSEWHDKWTKGYILNLHRTTAAKYQITEINGTEYLFMEWKMGNYIYGGMKPDYYVFKRKI